MKLNKIKKVEFIILFLLIFIFSALFFSCGDDSKNNDNGNIDGTTAINNENAEINENAENNAKSANSIEEKLDYDLPVIDCKGYNFRIISRSFQSNSHWWNHDISVEEENGDPINDAVYMRNKTIEERYNVTITNIPSDNISSQVSKSVRAGSDDYDLVVGGLNGCQEALTAQGYIQDLKTMPYVDLTKPWWDQQAVEQLSIANKLFATSSDLTIRDKDGIMVFIFSKKLIQELGLEDPYQLVLSGKWTFDKMLDMMKAASADLNGDGVINDEDQIGLLTQLSHGRVLFNAAGEYMSTLNTEKIPEISLYNERAVEVCEKINEIMSDKSLCINADEYGNKYTDVWDGFQIPMFMENRALFYHAGMNRVTLLRSMEADFGILPPPKYNEQQENYHALVAAWCASGISVPTTVSDPQAIGLLLEALVYESRYLLMPAYYDVNLKTKFARDEESSAMIDIILKSRLYDLGDVYGWGNMGGFFEGIVKGTGDSLAVYWEKNSTRIESAMQKTLDNLIN